MNGSDLSLRSCGLSTAPPASSSETSDTTRPEARGVLLQNTTESVHLAFQEGGHRNAFCVSRPAESELVFFVLLSCFFKSLQTSLIVNICVRAFILKGATGTCVLRGGVFTTAGLCTWRGQDRVARGAPVIDNDLN